MITFSLTNEQKLSALGAVLRNLEIEIYNCILNMGGDPESYDFTQVSEMAESIAPSNENRLYVAYNRYLDIKQKIDNF
jgi:hypothetical protein